VHLGLSPGAAVTSLRRLRRADGIVMAVEHSALPAAIVPDPQSIGVSLYSYLEQRGMAVVRALQHFRAVNATSEIASLMDIEPRSALLVITRIGYSATLSPSCANDSAITLLHRRDTGAAPAKPSRNAEERELATYRTT
jgi:DNA-binding GntR family transcriptional regulator